MVNKFLLFVSVLAVGAMLSGTCMAAGWYFPVGNYEGREQYKSFGQYFDKSFYAGKESLFPAQYTGFHAAADLEILPGEETKEVPVYAVTDGKISFSGMVGGYGGVISLDMANDPHTALYGHLKTGSSPFKAGDSVKAGQFLANLGKAFSSETGGERKHLHFGIYNGKSAYFKGYETSQQAIQNKWVDPGTYLKQKGAVDVNSQSSVRPDYPVGRAGSEQKGESNQNTAISNENTNVNDNIPESNIPVVQSDQNTQIGSPNEGFFSHWLQYLERMLSKLKSVI